MKLKHITRAVALALLLAFAINICYNALSWKDTTGGYLSAYEQLYNTPANTMDVVFVGTSHVYCGIYPSILWRDYGISSFDMAVSGQDRMSAYYDLKELLKTQKPQVVMVDLFAMRYVVQDYLPNEYRNLLGMKYSKNMISHIADYDMNPEIDRMDYYLRMPIIHTRYKELGKYDFQDYRPSIYGKGEDIYFINRDGYDGSELYCSKTEERATLGKGEYKWLENMKELSENEGFDLVFILVPAQLEDEVQARINSAVDWSEENGITVYDFNKQRKEIGITSANDFLDSTHLNAFGAEKLSRYLYDNVIKNYNLQDHRGEAAYKSWEQNLTRFCHEQTKRNLDTVIEAEDYSMIASSADNVTVFISVEGDLAEKDFSRAVQYFGIGDEWRRGGFWVYEDGKLRTLNLDELAHGVCLDLGRNDTARVKYNSCLAGDNIQINGHGVSGQNPGLNMVVYDHFLEEELSRREF